VEFRPRTTAGFSESDFQSTYLFDLIHYADALMHHIQTGDFILACDEQQGRFVPGEVLDGFEKRASSERKSSNVSFVYVRTVENRIDLFSRRNSSVARPFCQWKNVNIETFARSHLDTISFVNMSNVDSFQ
jgi:hypothetical protein